MLAKRGAISVSTSRPLASEWPKSPRNAPNSHSKNRTIAGRSSPRSSRSLARLSGVAEFCRIAEARSPGSISVPTKISTEAREQRQDAQAESLDDEFQHTRPAPWPRSGPKLVPRHRAIACRSPGAAAGRRRPPDRRASRARGYALIQAFSRIMPLSMSKPPCGVWPPTLSLCASSQSRNTGMIAPPSSCSIFCISQI